MDATTAKRGPTTRRLEMRLIPYSLTDVGKKREHNEDSFLVPLKRLGERLVLAPQLVQGLQQDPYLLVVVHEPAPPPCA